MDWMQVLFLFFANAGLILWFRAESRNDWRHMDTELKASSQRNQDLINAIHQEIKDFHGRLCAIEERRR